MSFYPRCANCGGHSTWTAGLSTYDLGKPAEPIKSIELHRHCVGDYLFIRGAGTTLTLTARNPNDERQFNLAHMEPLDDAKGS